MSGGAGGGSSKTLSNISSCGSSEVLLFALAVFFGTFTSICSKTMMSMSGTNGTTTPDGGGVVFVVEPFSKPLFQTFGMFVGMTFGLAMHALVVKFRVPFPGYDHRNRIGGTCASPAISLTTTAGAMTTEGTPLVSLGSDHDKDGTSSPAPATMEIPTSMYLWLAIPAVFDLGATALW